MLTAGELAPLADEEGVPSEHGDGLRTPEEQIADADQRTQLWLARRAAADARRSFGITVVSLTGNKREVQATADEKVEEFKLKVSKEMEISHPDLFMLVVSNKVPLEDEALALGAYGVEPGGSTTLNMAMQDAATAAARRRSREVARKEAAERKEAERIALEKLRAKQKRIASWSTCITVIVAVALLIVYFTAGCGGLDCGWHGECRGFFGAECFCAADTGRDSYDGELCPHYCTFEFHASRLSAADAEAQCVRDGGHLASLHSQADQETAHRLAAAAHVAHVWIGFHDRDDEQGSDGFGFKWNDGSATDYSNWKPGEPNQYKGFEEDCTIMYGDGTWNDCPCANEYAFVCKICGNPCAACACSGNFIQPPGHLECDTECDCNGHGTQTDIVSAWAAGSCSAGSCSCSGSFIGTECEIECDCSGDGADIDAARTVGTCTAGRCVCAGSNVVGDLCELDCSCGDHGTQTNIVAAREARSCEVGRCSCATGTNYAGGECLVSAINLAAGRPASQSSQSSGGAATRAVDGDRNGNYGANSCTHTTNDATEWWQVDLGSSKRLGHVDLYHRTDCCQERTGGTVFVSDTADYSMGTNCGTISSTVDVINCGGAYGQFVTVVHSGIITICEAEVFAATAPCDSCVCSGNNIRREVAMCDGSTPGVVDYQMLVFGCVYHEVVQTSYNANQNPDQYNNALEAFTNARGGGPHWECVVELETASGLSGQDSCGALSNGGGIGLGFHTKIAFTVFCFETYHFRFHADYGRGGYIGVDTGAHDHHRQDYGRGAGEIWGHVAITDLELGAGDHAFESLGFENCCDGHAELEIKIPSSDNWVQVVSGPAEGLAGVVKSCWQTVENHIAIVEMENEECDTECDCNGHGTQTDIVSAWAAGSCNAGRCSCSGNFIGTECKIECDCSGDGADIDAARTVGTCAAGGCVCAGSNVVGDLCESYCSCGDHGTQIGIAAARVAKSCSAGACTCAVNTPHSGERCAFVGSWLEKHGDAYYITLPDDNWSTYPPLRTVWNKIRISGVPTPGSSTVTVLTSDFTFAASNGKTSNAHGLTEIEWGIGADCTGSGSGEYSLNLAGLPFKLEDYQPAYAPGGYIPYGTATCTNNQTRCTGECGGYCGYCGFTHAGTFPEVTLEVTDQGEFDDAVTAALYPQCSSCACSGNFIQPPGHLECDTECDCNGHGTQTDIVSAWAAGSCSAGSCSCSGSFIGTECEIECDCSGDGADIDAARADDSCIAGGCIPLFQWHLAMNVNPSDGHNFGWGRVGEATGWPVDGASVGSSGNAFTADYMASSVWGMAANWIAIARHTNGVCNAAKAWRFSTPGHSLETYFADHSPGNAHQRVQVTSGGPAYVAASASANDPLLGNDGDLVFNWWYANNGARIASTAGHLSDASVNDDDTHGLGNEFGADTNSGGVASATGSSAWWHDASVIQGDCHGSTCITQGADHGTSLNTGPVLGSYAIYVSGDNVSLSDITFGCGTLEKVLP